MINLAHQHSATTYISSYISTKFGTISSKLEVVEEDMTNNQYFSLEKLLAIVLKFLSGTCLISKLPILWSIKQLGLIFNEKFYRFQNYGYKQYFRVPSSGRA